MRGGGCLYSGGVFQIDDVTRAMSKGGGVRLVFHPSKFRPPPHLAGWLRACRDLRYFNVLNRKLWKRDIFLLLLKPLFRWRHSLGTYRNDKHISRQEFTICRHGDRSVSCFGNYLKHEVVHKISLNQICILQII